ncbi:glutamate--tRNA ligase [Bacteroidota bacterium]
MADKKIRVRFAPSPTGPLHIGGVRTALFNYLFAKKNNGAFILRIEDTDQSRYVEGAEEYIIQSLKWCGINIDEGIDEGGEYGPYRQSERKNIYRKYAEQLINSANAYYAFDTPEELDDLRKNFDAEKKTFTYNADVRKKLRNSLVLSDDEVNALIEKGEDYVIRYKMPEEEEFIMNDMIRGEIRINTSVLDDKVLFKSDGMPTYHLANVVDDYLMKISHVIRGEEWLPSLPLHILLYRSFGWEKIIPEFAHLPLLLKPDGKGKLSKRDGDRLGFPVFPLNWSNKNNNETASGYREAGYFPEAFINILAFLGWNPGTEQEIFSLEELIQAFSIEKVGKSGSKFDPEKAKWYNHQYLQQYPAVKLAGLFKTFLIERGINANDYYISSVCELVKERANFVSDLWEQSYFFFEAPKEYDEKLLNKKWKNDTPLLMKELINIFSGINDFSVSELEKNIHNFLEKKGIGMGQIMNPLRLCIVGANKGPGMFEILGLLGKKEVISRVQTAINNLASD